MNKAPIEWDKACKSNGDPNDALKISTFKPVPKKKKKKKKKRTRHISITNNIIHNNNNNNNNVTHNHNNNRKRNYTQIDALTSPQPNKKQKIDGSNFDASKLVIPPMSNTSLDSLF